MNDDARRTGNGGVARLFPGRVEQTTPAPEPAPAPDRENPATVEPLAKARYKVVFTASEELRDKLKRLEALMPGSDRASIIDAAVSEKLERVEAKRYGKTKKPRKSLEDARVRGISAAVKRFVCKRDGNQCTYVGSGGQRCPERDKLEFHHDDPYGLDGDRSAENVRLLCTCHNAYMAELDYGKEKMDQYRRSADRVGEPLPTFELCPGRVTQYSTATQSSAVVH